MSSSLSPPEHAVVIGGGLAGLCAARALADYVPQVTVLERDRFPERPEVRPGLPQAHHLHVLLGSGQRALDELFPGLVTELYERGAVPVAAPTDMLYLTATGWRERFPATHRLVGASRELIDWTVWQRLVADRRVRFLPEHEVVGLLPDGDSSRNGNGNGDGVAGVVTRRRHQDGETSQLAADLVVDASGRGSRAPDWLAALGYPRPDEHRVDSGLAYASRRYRLPEGVADGWRNILLLPAPPRTSTGGVLYPVEDGQWMATLGGLGGERPPTDEAGFLEFARGLRSPVLYEALTRAEPLSPIYGFRATGNHRRRYEALSRWPRGFLVVGDAACTFNPVYGQGMSVAAQTAVMLARHLRTGPGQVSGATQAAVAECSAAAWMIATGADLRYPTTTGGRPRRRDRWSHRYLDRATDVANRDPYVCRVLTDVLHLLAPPAALLRPRVGLRVLRGRPGAPLWEQPPDPGRPG